MNVSKLTEKVKVALEQDNTLVVTKEDLNNTSGFTEAHMAQCGLSKQDLKHLESRGMARRGYVKIPRGNLHEGSTTQLRWILIGATNDLSKD
jgi:hypothetical protein